MNTDGKLVDVLDTNEVHESCSHDEVLLKKNPYLNDALAAVIIEGPREIWLALEWVGVRHQP